MEPNNIEDVVKTRLKEIEITPSDQARARLIAKLNSEPKKKKIPWFRYSIAATILLFFSVLGFQLLSNDLEAEQPIQITTKIQESGIKSNTTIVIQEDSKQDKLKKEDKNQDQKVLVNPTEDEVVAYTLPKNRAQLHVEINTDTSQPILKTSDIELHLSNNLIDSIGFAVSTETKLDTIEVRPLQPFSFITAKALVAAVANDSSAKLLKPTKKTSASYVNSNRLLLEMERQLLDEDNKSIFKKATRQLKKIKTSVANRNFKN